MAINERNEASAADKAAAASKADDRPAPTDGAGTATMPSEHEIMRALKAVYDPELGISIVDLGLVYGLDIDEEAHKVIVNMTLTTPACPLGPMIRTQAHAVLTSNFDAIRDVDMNLVWTPRWDPRTMASEEAKAELGIW